MTALRYRVQGAGAPLLLLHGFLGSSEDWAPVIGQLHGRTRCITVDLPGHGDQRAVEMDCDRFADALVEILDELSLPQAGVLGYSMGGRSALYAALKHPQRFSCLIMASASPGLENEAERPARRRWEQEWAEKLRTRPLIEVLWEWYDQPLFATLKARSDFPQILQRRLQNDPQALAQALLALGAGAQPSLWAEIATLPLRLYWAAGEKDEKYRRLTAKVQSMRADAVVTIVPECGHALHLENPHRLARFIENALDAAA